jgi:hypothetical protein
MNLLRMQDFLCITNKPLEKDMAIEGKFRLHLGCSAFSQEIIH